MLGMTSTIERRCCSTDTIHENTSKLSRILSFSESLLIDNYRATVLSCLQNPFSAISSIIKPVVRSAQVC